MIFWGCLVFSRENRRPKRAKMKFCFTFGAFVVLLSSSFVVAVVVSTGCRCAGSLACPLGAGGQALWGFRTCQRLLWSSVRVFRPFCPFSRFVFGALRLKYAFIRVFRGVFSGFPLLDVGLYCLRALRGLCGFCVREWLGGLEA